jgi:hypothetical protein
MPLPILMVNVFSDQHKLGALFITDLIEIETTQSFDCNLIRQCTVPNQLIKKLRCIGIKKPYALLNWSLIQMWRNRAK